MSNTNNGACCQGAGEGGKEMTLDELVAMVERASDPDTEPALNAGLVTLTLDELERLAALVAAAEREACAKVCDRVSCFHEVQEGADLAFDLATSIRARGKQ